MLATFPKVHRPVPNKNKLQCMVCDRLKANKWIIPIPLLTQNCYYYFIKNVGLIGYRLYTTATTNKSWNNLSP